MTTSWATPWTFPATQGGIEFRQVGAGLQLDDGAALWAEVSLNCDRHHKVTVA
jgi:hypothetical protein